MNVRKGEGKRVVETGSRDRNDPGRILLLLQCLG